MENNFGVKKMEFQQPKKPLGITQLPWNSIQGDKRGEVSLFQSLDFFGHNICVFVFFPL